MTVATPSDKMEELGELEGLAKEAVLLSVVISEMSLLRLS